MRAFALEQSASLKIRFIFSSSIQETLEKNSAESMIFLPHIFIYGRNSPKANELATNELVGVSAYLSDGVRQRFIIVKVWIIDQIEW